MSLASGNDETKFLLLKGSCCVIYLPKLLLKELHLGKISAACVPFASRRQADGMSSAARSCPE